MSSNPGAALAEIAQQIGASHVEQDGAALAGVRRNVSGLERSVAAVIRPGSTAEVQAVVRAANRHGLPLYPFSRGKNWGLGSRLPVRDGAALVDLGRMNRIREVSAEFAYAVIEPGVTQGQLHTYLMEKRLPLRINVIGSGLETSLLGNALDRGVGYFAARAGSLSGLEVVLGTGEVLRTGMAHFPNPALAHLYKYGVGPSLDGLFAQSNLGIVTAAGLDLMPWHDHHASAIVKIGRAAQLAELVDAVADLRRRDVVRMIVHIGNRARTIGTLAPLVYRNLPAEVRRDPALARASAESLLEQEGFGPWSAVLGIGGTKEQIAAASREIRRVFTGLAPVAFLTDRKIASARRLLKRLSFLPGARRKSAILEAMAPLLGFASGLPSDAALPSVYWTAGLTPPESGPFEPDESPCGLLYSLPILPLNGRAAAECVAETERVFGRFGFTPMITLNAMDERAIETVISLPFRRDDAKAVEKAHTCLNELQRAWVERGWYPYRIGIQEMDLLVDGSDPFWQTVRDLKRVFDPNGILAPGRYNLV